MTPPHAAPVMVPVFSDAPHAPRHAADLAPPGGVSTPAASTLHVPVGVVRPPLLPDLDAVPAEPVIIAEPDVHSVRLSETRRLCGQQAFTAAGIPAASGVTLTVRSGWLLITAALESPHRIDAKGRLLLPRRLCAHLGWPPGVLLVMIADTDSVAVNRVAHLLADTPPPDQAEHPSLWGASW